MFDNIPFMPRGKTSEEKLFERQADLEREMKTKELSAQDDMTYIGEQEKKSDLLKWQQDLGEELIECVQTLRGYAKDEDGEWKKVRETPLCNDKFIYEVVVPQCKPFLSRNLINSNFDEKRILKMLRFTMDDITDAMTSGWDLYDIEFMNFDIVTREIKNVI